MNPLTRLAIDEDQEVIDSLYREWGRAYGNSLNDCYIVAELEGAVVGVVNLAFDDPHFVIRSLYVSEAHRHLGVATALLQAVEHELGIAEVFCLCFRDQEPLGQKIGLQQIGGMTAPDFLRERYERIREIEPEAIMLKRGSSVEVRPLTIADIWHAMSLLEEFELPAVKRLKENDIRQIYSKIVNAGGVVLGAFKRDKLVGTCTLNICANLSWSGRPYGIVENIIVTKAERNNGIGKYLLLVAARTAVSKDCYKVALMTQQKTNAADAFYKSAGFSDDKVGYQIRFHAPLAI